MFGIQSLALPRPRRRGSALALRIIGTISGGIATVVVTLFLVYAGLALAPGDPISQILGPRASSEQRAALREQLGLNEPVLVRFVDWFGAVLHGDLGRSLVFKEGVAELIGARVPTTALLVLMSAAIILVIGVGLGILGGVSPKLRAPVSALVGIGIAVPNFVAAGFLIGFFAVALGWFPTYGAGEGFTDHVWHLTLPAIALSITSVAYVAQISSTAIFEEIDKEYVYTSLGRGVPFAKTVRVHILRNAALPILTASGLCVAGLIAGTVIVEQAFAISGIGQLLVQSVTSKDYPVVAAVSMIIVITFVAIMTLIDIFQLALDPRERDGVK